MMNEDPSGEERAINQTRSGIVSVPGPATSDPYSTQGDSSDEEGGRENGYLRSLQDEAGAAAQALLGGISTSASEGTRTGGAGGNWKGHHADDDTWWKRARMYARGTIGQANWHIRSMARQQTLRVVKSREKAATETALSQALHCKGTVAGRGEDVLGPPYSTSVGRGLSGLWGGEGADRAGVELGILEAGGVDVAGTSWGDERMGGFGGVGPRVLHMTGSNRGNTNGGVRGGGSGSTLKRGGRQAVTTGDLVKLLHEEECGPAPNNSKSVANKVQRPSANGVVGGPTCTGTSARWSIGGGTLARRASEGVSLAHVSREDRWASGDRSFKVLGVEIGHLPDSQQFMVCAGGVFAFLLIYGFMQEYLVVQIFNRTLGLFLTLLQFFGYATCAWLRRCTHRGKERKIPLTFYFFLGLLQACMQALTNVSMMYLNYPAKVLFKSSRMVPIMCFGVLWQGRKYTWKEIVVVFLIVTGLVTFMNADTRAAEPDSGPTSLVGVALISLALVIDAALINIQEEIMNKYNSCQDELIMFTYLSGTVFIAFACLYTGDLIEGCLFVYEQGIWCILAVMLFAGAGFLGVSCVAALTKRFGALASAITTTARKAGTLFLSFVVFPKPVSLQHYVGACLFITGLVIKTTGKRDTRSSSQQQSGGLSGDTKGETSPPATPMTFQMTRQRKRYSSKESDQFDTSTEAPLLSGTGNGGYSSNGGGHGTNGSGGDPDAPAYGRSNGTAAVSGNSGGNPVRHRGTPKNGSWNSAANSPRAGGLGGVAIAGNEAGGEVGGYCGSRHAAEDSNANAIQEAFRSPRRRIFPGGSPPVTGLGMRL